MSPRSRRRKCRHCQQLFLPDPYNRYHQRFCSAADCQCASKAQSQQLWLAKLENQDYWRGPQHTERVRRWRKEHPGYGRRSPSKAVSPLQEVLPLQISDAKPVESGLTPSPLQDVLSLQHPFVVGLISMLTHSTLQEDIVGTSRRLLAKGCDILGMVSGGRLLLHDQKTPPTRSAPPPAQPVQLDRSTLDPPSPPPRL